MTRPILYFALLMATLLPFIGYAQSDTTAAPEKLKPQKPPLSDRIFVGGGIAATFGTVTYVGLAPVVGYQVTPKLMAGIGISYYYYQDNRYAPPYKNSIYGGMLFSRYMIFKGLYAEANFEENSQVVYALDPTNGNILTQREWIPSLLLGGGYSQSMGRNSAVFISILYDVIQNPNSQYYKIPVIRAGFGIGL